MTLSSKETTRDTFSAKMRLLSQVVLNPTGMLNFSQCMAISLVPTESRTSKNTMIFP